MNQASNRSTPQSGGPTGATILGWAFVAIQAILLVALVVLPSSDHWPTPSWLRTAGTVLVGVGLLETVVASLRLGRSLTPTPVPRERGSLATDGLYRYVRHPIYTGVLCIVAGLVAASGNVSTLAVGAVTVGFFHLKARWEEHRLAEHYPDYEAYAAVTPRFIPRPRRH
ncbi:MAG: isoprenylcysteine carboxylmethyltransferase family protein [Acidimicrobiales bacterium]